MNLTDKSKSTAGMGSFWGSDHSNSVDGRMVFARIYAVDSDKRTCSIKTYGNDPVVSNADYTNAQWLNPYSSPLGDEISFVPEANSQVLVTFCGGIPWIIGFYQPISIDPNTEVSDLEFEGLDPSGGSAAQNKEKINVGDIILRTAGKCRVVLRRGGEIEIEATKLCKRIHFPARNLINELCQNYEFRTDGGSIDWIHPDKDSDDTVYRAEWRDNISRRNIIFEEKGTVEKNSDIIHRVRIGAGTKPNPLKVAPGTPSFVYFEETHNTGKKQFKINDVAYTQLINPDGEFELGINNYTYYKNIKPTGEMKINANNKFQMVTLPTGETTVDIGITSTKNPKDKPPGGKGKFQLNIKPDGTSTVLINEKIDLQLKSDGNVTLNCGNGGGILTIDPSGKVTLIAKTEVNIETPTVNLKASLIKLGESISDVVPLGRLLLTAINKFIVIFNTHTHTSPFLGIPTSPPNAAQKQLKDDLLSSSVKVQS